jgi:beta-glucosidase
MLAGQLDAALLLLPCFRFGRGVDVRNTGERDGDEVVQLCDRNVEPPVVQPLRQLKGFRRVHAKAGETAAVEIPLAIAGLAHWDEEGHCWLVEPGEFELQVGAASDDIRLTRTIVVR